MDDTGKEVEMSSPEAEKEVPLTRGQIEERAKTVAPLEVSAEELTKKVVKSQQEEIPLALPGTHPVITEELKAFEKALKTGEYAGMKVLGEVSHGGRRGLKVEPEKGQTVVLDLGVHEIINAGVIPDPEIADLANSETVRAWVEKVLRSFERNEDRKITSQVEDSLTATISSKVPVGILNPAGATYIHNAPDGRPEGLSQELIRLVEARVAYHNSGLSARLGLGNLGEEYGGITLNEHLQIFNTPGVKDAIMQLEENNGEYYRLGNPAAREAIIKANLRRYFNTDPRFAGTTAVQKAEAAELAFELAIKTMHIHGESGHYTGIKNIHGNYIFFTGSKALEQYAKYFEEHWDEIAFYRDRTTGAPIVDATGRAVTNLATLPPAVAANAVWNQLSGEGALHEKGTYYTPIFLENPLSPNRGTAAFLRRYAYTWVNSGVTFFRTPTDTAARTSMAEAIDHYGEDWAKWFVWTARASGAHKGREVFAEKGLESILNMPLINPNVLLHDDSLQTINSVMENYKKAVQAYVGLPQPEKQRAMTHLLKGVLRYVDRRNLNQARREGFNWIGLTQKNMDDIIYWATREDIITNEQAGELKREVRISTAVAAGQAAVPHLGEGLGAFWKTIWSGITKS